jgi:cytoskeletal protein CcmA (bactofilin family)
MTDDRSDLFPTFIASGAKVHGPLVTSGDVTVAGRVDGNLRADGAVSVLAGGSVTAELRGTRVRIEGAVIGNVFASERIEVLAGARVVGDLRAPTIELAPGAVVEGRVDQRVPAAEALPVDARPTLRLARPLRRPSAPKSEEG